MTHGYGISFQQEESVKVDLHASLLSRTVVPIIFRKEGVQVSSDGTAFCVAALKSGDVIFATAAHVIDRLASAADLECFILLPKGLATEKERNSLAGVRVHQVSLAETYNDVALVVANINEGELTVTTELESLPITFAPPRIGEFCLALGYPQEQGGISYEMLGSRGVIEEIHPRRRDSTLSTFPSFRTTALLKPGMSGGPIINEKGRVIGVISHGTEADEVSLVTGYGASIATIAEFRLDLRKDDSEVSEFTIKQLAEMGILGADRCEVSLIRTDDGVTLEWHPSED